MHVTRWVLAILVTVSVVLAAVSVRVHRGGGGGFPSPSSGRMLPFDTALVGEPRVLGTLGDGEMDEVVDVATTGDTIYMLSRTSWRSITGTRSRGPFGEQPSGGPEGIDRGARIISANGSIYILDTNRREVTRWSTDGGLIERVRVGAAARPIVPLDIAIVADGTVFVVAQEFQREGARWVLLRVDADSSRVLREGAGNLSLFTQPRIAAAHDELLLFDPVSHATEALFSGQVRPRTDGPVWATPDSLREQFAARVGRLGTRFGTSLTLPDSMPSLQAAVVTRAGVVLTGSNPVGDALHIEAFRPDGTPLGRISLEPLPAPVFLTADGVVRVAETPHSIVFTLLPIRR